MYKMAWDTCTIFKVYHENAESINRPNNRLDFGANFHARIDEFLFK